MKKRKKQKQKPEQAMRIFHDDPTSYELGGRLNNKLALSLMLAKYDIYILGPIPMKPEFAALRESLRLHHCGMFAEAGEHFSYFCRATIISRTGLKRQNDKKKTHTQLWHAFIDARLDLPEVIAHKTLFDRADHLLVMMKSHKRKDPESLPLIPARSTVYKYMRGRSKSTQVAHAA